MIAYKDFQVPNPQLKKGLRYAKDLKSNEVKNLMDKGYFVKVFQSLPKSEIGWTNGETEYKQYMLELMEEYAFPKPMPEDLFHKYHVVSDQAYLMLATAGTGKAGPDIICN